MADEAENIRKFRDITNLDEEHAKECLEAANNDLQVAIHTFFGGGVGGSDAIDIDLDDEELEVLPSPTLKKHGKPYIDLEHDDSLPPPVLKKQDKPSDSRFKTVANLNQDSSSDEEEGGQAFYAGGSTTSGQQVLGPGRSRSQIVADMFRSVREHGGETVEQDLAPGPSGPRKPNTLKFSGTGYKLGQTAEDTEVIKVGESSGGRPQVTITLKMWRQGFSINEGPLRDYKEPENMQFLKTVSRGIIPDELLQQARGNEVHLNMEDHSSEEYVFTKPKLQAFAGKGNVLGSPVPGVVASAPPPSASSATDRPSCEARAREAVPLDTAQPTTSVQIRLADGSRLVATFNHTHTVAQLRTYITTARPEYASSSFRLLTTFPSNELSDEAATISAAGILNAALLQRLA